MKNKLPKIIIQFSEIADAWIVGSAADPKVKSPRDWDIVVVPYMWKNASRLIPNNAKPNSFGGWKFSADDIEIDIWPSDLHDILIREKTKFAWNPKTWIRILKI